jgi:hypothetical protein
MSPRGRVTELNIQAAGSLLVVFYDFQGYVGGILNPRHTGSKML